MLDKINQLEEENPKSRQKGQIYTCFYSWESQKNPKLNKHSMYAEDLVRTHEDPKVAVSVSVTHVSPA